MDSKKLIFNFLLDAQEEDFFKLKSLESEKKVVGLVQQINKIFEEDKNKYFNLFLNLEASIEEMKIEIKKEFFKLGYLSRKSEEEITKE
ncbi:hypothetical protein [Fusobacterium varium]|uniref:hypothetical protein n=1 Tax=Fusobacterium varium TaxID=856 RepID=UPI00266CCA21|nr:hypothetical protein [Fusobacterium varium]